MACLILGAEVIDCTVVFYLAGFSVFFIDPVLLG